MVAIQTSRSRPPLAPRPNEDGEPGADRGGVTGRGAPREQKRRGAKVGPGQQIVLGLAWNGRFLKWKLVRKGSPPCTPSASPFAPWPFFCSLVSLVVARSQTLPGRVHTLLAVCIRQALCLILTSAVRRRSCDSVPLRGPAWIGPVTSHNLAAGLAAASQQPEPHHRVLRART